jgi:ADP-dependent NAD(P)H-hydrate dehydratase
MPEVKLEDLTKTPLPTLRPRDAESHKGDFGRALLVGGSRGMSGAISLAGQAALRSGAGLVTLAVPHCVLDVVASIEPSYMTSPLVDEDDHIGHAATEAIVGLAQSATALALGPGLGRRTSLTELVTELYDEIKKPMVVDADALFALAERTAALTTPGGPRILTPHPGEFVRITGSLPEEPQRPTAAAELAQRDTHGTTILVLKGHNTVVTDGTRFSINLTGNPGMATGGSGDVLTGIITALLCQGLEPFDAARLGVHVHGLAGDLAANELGQVSMIASDLIHYLPKAFQAVVG